MRHSTARHARDTRHAGMPLCLYPHPILITPARGIWNWPSCKEIKSAQRPAHAPHITRLRGGRCPAEAQRYSAHAGMVPGSPASAAPHDAAHRSIRCVHAAPGDADRQGAHAATHSAPPSLEVGRASTSSSSGSLGMTACKAQSQSVHIYTSARLQMWLAAGLFSLNERACNSGVHCMAFRCPVCNNTQRYSRVLEASGRCA
jgi:hypothetical protein